MYDWDALWHEHEGFRSGFDVHHNDANQLADHLAAKLMKAAQHPSDIAVYETADKFILAGHADGLQLLEVMKHGLFDITLRLVSEDEGLELSLPYVEIHVDNLATEEQAVWRGELSRHEDDSIWIDQQPLDGQLDQPFPLHAFSQLSFARDAHFQQALQEVWQNDLPQLQALIQAWFQHAERSAESVPHHYGDEKRVQQICDRYAEIVRREQAALSRMFSDAELQLIAHMLHSVRFEEAASCRGVWLAVEARMIDEELDQHFKLDGEALLVKMKALSYAQEVSLIEALSPLAAQAAAE